MGYFYIWVVALTAARPRILNCFFDGRPGLRTMRLREGKEQIGVFFVAFYDVRGQRHHSSMRAHVRASISETRESGGKFGQFSKHADVSFRTQLELHPHMAD